MFVSIGNESAIVRARRHGVTSRRDVRRARAGATRRRGRSMLIGTLRGSRAPRDGLERAKLARAHAARSGRRRRGLGGAREDERATTHGSHDRRRPGPRRGGRGSDGRAHDRRRRALLRGEQQRAVLVSVDGGERRRADRRAGSHPDRRGGGGRRDVDQLAMLRAAHVLDRGLVLGQRQLREADHRRERERERARRTRSLQALEETVTCRTHSAWSERSTGTSSKRRRQWQRQ